MLCVGSDCSGLGAEHFALKLLGLDARAQYVFASEKDATTRQVYLANHANVETMYESCCNHERNPTDVPEVTLYVAGPPCQSWSNAGLKKHLNCEGGSVLLDVVTYIVHGRPTHFIIEQVAAFAKTDEFKKVMEILKQVEWRGKAFYHFEHKILNTAEITKLPQNRPRVYIAGAARAKMVGAFTWPAARRCEVHASE